MVDDILSFIVVYTQLPLTFEPLKGILVWFGPGTCNTVEAAATYVVKVYFSGGAVIPSAPALNPDLTQVYKDLLFLTSASFTLVHKWVYLNSIPHLKGNDDSSSLE